MRRLAWATDVHLNFLDKGGVEAFANALKSQGADAVILTGDIAEAPTLEPLLNAVARLIGVPIYFVLGNHDYYRSSIAAVRARMVELNKSSKLLRWLPDLGVVHLTPGIGLVGVDGWSDARYGSYEKSPVMLNDFFHIEELTGLDKEARRRKLNQLGDDEAARLRGPLWEALERYEKALVAVHVPPFKEATWHEGKVSNDDYLPHFSCRAVGDVLLEAARAFPKRKIRVLCGHTHGFGKVEVLPNLAVVTGAAEYGEPKVQGVFELS